MSSDAVSTKKARRWIWQRVELKQEPGEPDTYLGYPRNENDEVVVQVAVSPQVLDLLIDLVASGCFGLDVEDVARRMLDKQVLELMKEGWLPMPDDGQRDGER